MLKALFKSMRPRQWVKNIFAFVPLIFDAQLSVERIVNTLIAFVLLCFMSSAVYLMNDLSDIEADKLHPTKRFRPIPAGDLPVSIGWTFAVLFSLGSILIAYLVAPLLALVMAIYFVVQIAYTFRLKHVVLLDVFIVALGFILRIAAGASVIELRRFSPWLYIFGGFLALFMILGKRRYELVLLGENASSTRKILEEYSIDLIDKFIGIITTCAIVSYTLYTFLAEGLPENNSMMLTIPFVIYGVFRYLYLIHIRQAGGAPEEILLRDRAMQICLVIFGAVVVLSLYVIK